MADVALLEHDPDGPAGSKNALISIPTSSSSAMALFWTFLLIIISITVLHAAILLSIPVPRLSGPGRRGSDLKARACKWGQPSAPLAMHMGADGQCIVSRLYGSVSSFDSPLTRAASLEGLRQYRSSLGAVMAAHDQRFEFGSTPNCLRLRASGVPVAELERPGESARRSARVRSTLTLIHRRFATRVASEPSISFGHAYDPPAFGRSVLARRPSESESPSRSTIHGAHSNSQADHAPAFGHGHARAPVEHRTGAGADGCACASTGDCGPAMPMEPRPEDSRSPAVDTGGAKPSMDDTAVPSPALYGSQRASTDAASASCSCACSGRPSELREPEPAGGGVKAAVGSAPNSNF